MAMSEHYASTVCSDGWLWQSEVFLQDERKQEAAQAARERDFKAKMGPKSVPAFRLDAAKVKPTTIPKPFKLSSSKVVHTLYSEKERNEQQPPTQLCTPQGVMTEFARSLRAARGEH